MSFLPGNLIKGLKEQGFTVDDCEDGDTGFFLALENSYDVFLLDIMLPGRDGLSILKNFREEHNNNVPVIVLTARSALNERLEGLNLGADDYLCKPFFNGELIARIHAVCRRAAGDATNIIQFRNLSVNIISLPEKDWRVGSWAIPILQFSSA